MAACAVRWSRVPPARAAVTTASASGSSSTPTTTSPHHWPSGSQTSSRSPSGPPGPELSVVARAGRWSRQPSCAHGPGPASSCGVWAATTAWAAPHTSASSIAPATCTDISRGRVPHSTSESITATVTRSSTRRVEPSSGTTPASARSRPSRAQNNSRPIRAALGGVASTACADLAAFRVQASTAPAPSTPAAEIRSAYFSTSPSGSGTGRAGRGVRCAGICSPSPTSSCSRRAQTSCRPRNSASWLRRWQASRASGATPCARACAAAPARLIAVSAWCLPSLFSSSRRRRGWDSVTTTGSGSMVSGFSPRAAAKAMPTQSETSDILASAAGAVSYGGSGRPPGKSSASVPCSVSSRSTRARRSSRSSPSCS